MDKHVVKLNKRPKNKKKKINDFGFYVVSEYEGKVNLPKKKTRFSAGYDFEAAEEVVIEPGEVKIVPTGIKAKFPPNVVLKLYPRSSTSIKKKLILVNSVGIIDSDYYNNPSNEGHIMFAFYNIGKEPYTIKKGEAIGQGIFEPIVRFDKYDEENTILKKRSGGIGSTG